MPNDGEEDDATLNDLLAERDRLLAEKSANANVMAQCKGQIDAAKATAIEGEYADPHWFAAVTAKARHCGRRDQELASQLAALRTMIKQKQVALNQPAPIGDLPAEQLLGQAIDLIREAIRLLKKDR